MIIQSQENGNQIDLAPGKGIPKTAMPFIANAHEGSLFRTTNNGRSFAIGAGIVNGKVVREDDEPGEADEIDEAVDRINAREAKNAERIKTAIEQAKKFVGKKNGGSKVNEQHPVYRMTKGEAVSESENAG